jgi:MFS family permease
MNLPVTLPQREVRRSFALGVFNGVAFQFAEQLIDPALILTWFVSQLTASNLLVGLVAPLANAGWMLPQIFVSARVQRMQRKMPSYRLAAAIRALCWMLLAATLWWVDDPRLLLLSFFTLYAIARLSAGLGGLAFLDVVAKTIPARQRGGFFAWRQLLGGLLGLAAAWITTLILGHPALAFPRGHALLIAFYCVITLPAMLAFIMIHEPPGLIVAEPVTPRQQLRRAGQRLQSNPVFRRYIAVQLTLALASVAVPFYGVYAKNVLDAPVGIVGIYMAVRIGAQLLFTLPWGRLSDRRGNHLLLRAQILGRGGTALLALALVGLVGLLRLQGGWLPYLVLPLFFLDGAVLPTLALTGSNFLLELVPDAERPLYLGLANTLIGVTILLSGLVGGLVVDLVGFGGLFLLTFVLCLLAFGLTARLPEPRRAGG